MAASSPSSQRTAPRPAGPGAVSGRPGIVVAVAIGWSLLLPAGAGAQTATVETEENFRAEPNGTVIARLEAGTVLSVSESRDRWIRGTLEGWVWTPSLQNVEEGDFDLRVAADGGENLRAEPQGTILARLEEGALLEELERIEGWIRVRRTAWIWEPSARLDRAAAAGAGAEEAAATAPAELAEGWRRRESGEAAILTGPDGDTLGRAFPGTELRVLGRQGNWARVRLEGWTWLPGSDDGEPADTAVLTDVTPADVSGDPEAYEGRVVAWELQYISREEAEQVRTDFYEGEPYLLTRQPGSSEQFVYVAIPPDRVDGISDLTPLERITVVGRIRAGSAALTGGPILDLLQLSRGGGGSDGGS